METPHFRPDTVEVRQQVTPLLLQLATLRERPLLCFYHEESIDEACLIRIRELAPTLGEQRRVSVLLDSPGGEIGCTYRMLNAIRRHVDDMEVLVPQWAKSAATFFCLGADKILLGPDGELGPLDPQIPNPSGSFRPVTPLETFQALEQLRTYSADTLDTIVMALLGGAPMDIPNAIQQAPPIMSAMIGPLYQQVNHHELGEAGRALQVGVEYARRVMHRWGYADREQENIDRIVRDLVWGYPTHGFVIDLTEAKELGLKAEELDEEADGLCKRILKGCGGCVGVFMPDQDATPVNEKEGATSDGTASEDGIGRVSAHSGGQNPRSTRGARGARPAPSESDKSAPPSHAPPNGAEAPDSR